MFLLVWTESQFSKKIRKFTWKSSPNPTKIHPKTSENRWKIENKPFKKARWRKMRSKSSKTSKKMRKMSLHKGGINLDRRSRRLIPCAAHRPPHQKGKTQSAYKWKNVAIAWKSIWLSSARRSTTQDRKGGRKSTDSASINALCNAGRGAAQSMQSMSPKVSKA